MSFSFSSVDRGQYYLESDRRWDITNGVVSITDQVTFRQILGWSEYVSHADKCVSSRNKRK